MNFVGCELITVVVSRFKTKIFISNNLYKTLLKYFKCIKNECVEKVGAFNESLEW